MATFRLRRILYADQDDSNNENENLAPQVDESKDTNRTEEVDKSKSPSEYKKVDTEGIADKIGKKPSNVVLPSQLEKINDQKKSKDNLSNRSRSTQNKNIGVRINKTTTVINPSNEKVNQYKMIQESQKIAQDSGKPDPNLIPKAPEPLKPIGLFKR